MLAVTGILKGFDQLLNLVLDECLEFLRDPEAGAYVHSSLGPPLQLNLSAF